MPHPRKENSRRSAWPLSFWLKKWNGIMLLADSNIWLALALSKHGFNSTARVWLGEQTQSETVCFCRATQQSFLRLLTTQAVMAPYGIPPLTNKAAWSAYEGFLADGRISRVEEPRGLEASWKRLALNPKASPKLWMDAYLAALAITGGHRLVTTDKAFKQFIGARPSRAVEGLICLREAGRTQLVPDPFC